MALEVSITNKQKIHIKLNPKNDEGGPATIDGPATFAIGVGDLTLQPDADGLGCTIVSGTAVGDFTVLVEGDVDLSPAIKFLKEAVLVKVTASVPGETVDFGITADAAQPK